MVISTYAGIGSRSTPAHVLDLMTRIAAALGRDGYRLRSGGAEGADTAFAHGAPEADIFLPWPTFGQHAPQFEGHHYLDRPTREAWELAANFHPNWLRLGQASRNLMARNSHQVLGPKLNDPVRFIICWTPGAHGGGGTGQAIRIARSRGIPVFDLADAAVMDRLLTYCERSELTLAHSAPPAEWRNYRSPRR